MRYGFLLVLALLTACSSSKLFTGTTFETIEGEEYLVNRKAEFPAFNVTSSELLDGTPTIKVIQYNRKPTVKTDPPIVYCEYLVPVTEGVVSSLFWSKESPYWFQRESRGIVNTLVLQPE